MQKSICILENKIKQMTVIRFLIWIQIYFSEVLERYHVFLKPEPLDNYYSGFMQKPSLVSSYTLTVRAVQIEIHNQHGKCICSCGYFDKHTRLNFYFYELQESNICQRIVVRTGEDLVLLRYSINPVNLLNVIRPANKME